MDDLIGFLRERLDEDELWAVEASRRGDGPVAEGGVHWRWEDPATDQPVKVNPGEDEFVGGDSFRVSLRSREEWPTASGLGSLPQFAIPEAEEVPSAVGGHIARHDPSRVLAEVEAKRGILEAHGGDLPEQPMFCGHCEHDTPCPTLRFLAAPYSSHPDYRPEWAPAA